MRQAQPYRRQSPSATATATETLKSTYPCGKIPRRLSEDPYRSQTAPSVTQLTTTTTTTTTSRFVSSAAGNSFFFSQGRLALEMEQTSSFRHLFNAALQDYQNQTGNSLIDHSFTKQLESCNSVDSITAILEEQAQIFRNFRGDDGKLVKSIKYSVNILYTLSTNTASIGLVRQKLFIKFSCF